MATTTPYVAFLLDLGEAGHDFVTDTIKVALLTNGYTPSAGTDVSFDDVSTYEVAGTGYTAGGEELVDKVWSYDSGITAAKLVASPVSWAELSTTTRYAVIYKDTGVSTTSRLIAYLDFETDRVYVAEPFQLSFTNGVVQLPIVS